MTPLHLIRILPTAAEIKSVIIVHGYMVGFQKSVEYDRSVSDDKHVLGDVDGQGEEVAELREGSCSSRKCMKLAMPISASCMPSSRENPTHGIDQGLGNGGVASRDSCRL